MLSLIFIPNCYIKVVVWCYWFNQKETNVSQEDDVEMPLFDNEEKISDDEVQYKRI